jgi:hypothetical protein
MSMFDELLQGWGNAFDEIASLEEHRKKAVVIKYARYEAFDLEDYVPGSSLAGSLPQGRVAPGNFPPGVELLDRVPENVLSSYEEYGLDTDGLPCYRRTVYDNGWLYAGFYRYSAEAVEYVQFLDSGIPNCFQCVMFQDGRKIAAMRVWANGGGLYHAGMTAREAIEMARRNEGSMFLDHRRCVYADGRIVRDLTHYRVPGPGEYSV